MAVYDPNSNGTVTEGKRMVTVEEVSVKRNDYGPFVELTVNTGPFVITRRIFKDWMKLRLVSNARPKVTQRVDTDKEEDLQVLVGREIPVILYKAANGYFEFYTVIGHDNYAEQSFQNSIEQGFIKLAENSIFNTVEPESKTPEPEAKPAEDDDLPF